MGYSNVESEEAFDEFLENAADKLVVADFWATWCGPCRMIGPHFDKLSDNADYGNVIFLKVDVDEVGELAEEFEISVMPTFIFFKNGEKVDEIVGANKERLIEMLDKYK